MLDVMKNAFEGSRAHRVRGIECGNVGGWRARKWIEASSFLWNLDVLAQIRIKATGGVGRVALMKAEKNIAARERRRMHLERGGA